MNQRITMFDLGGVLYHIRLERTRDSLSLLAGRPIDFSLQSQHEVFDAFECGLIGAHEFRQGLRDAYAIDASDEDLDAAWNALLVGLDARSIDWVRQAATTSSVILLSNINELHHARIANECSQLFSQFHRLYLSYQLGSRKPREQIFRHVLHDMNVDAEQIWYIDDSPQHIAMARSLGIHSYQVSSIDDVPRVLSSFETA